MASRLEAGESNFILLQQKGRDFLAAARVLFESHPNPINTKHGMPIAFLLGHAVEVTLKGLISIELIPSTEDVPKGHDLQALWENPLISASLKLTNTEIDVLSLLNGVYGHPHLVRYPRLGLYELPNPLGFELIIKIVDRLSDQLDTLARAQDLLDPSVKNRLGSK